MEWSIEDYPNLSKQLRFTDGPLWLNDNILISETIPADECLNLTEEFIELLKTVNLLEIIFLMNSFLQLKMMMEYFYFQVAVIRELYLH